MGQRLPQKFCWQALQTRPPEGAVRRGPAGFALDSGQKTLAVKARLVRQACLSNCKQHIANSDQPAPDPKCSGGVLTARSQPAPRFDAPFSVAFARTRGHQKPKGIRR